MCIRDSPLTVYGTGDQTRGVINIRDTVECIRLAATHPPEPGVFRVFNQLTQSFSIRELAKTVSNVYPGPVTLDHLDNPRVEAESHYYQVVATGLPALGLTPHLLDDALLSGLFDLVGRHRDRIDPAALLPTVTWRPPGAPATSR